MLYNFVIDSFWIKTPAKWTSLGSLADWVVTVPPVWNAIKLIHLLSPTRCSNQFKSIQINSNQFKSIQISSNQFKSIQINSNQFKSIQINSPSQCCTHQLLRHFPTLGPGRPARPDILKINFPIYFCKSLYSGNWFCPFCNPWYPGNGFYLFPDTLEIDFAFPQICSHWSLISFSFSELILAKCDSPNFLSDIYWRGHQESIFPFTYILC